MLVKLLQQPPGARWLKQQVSRERDRCGGRDQGGSGESISCVKNGESTKSSH